MNEKKPEVLIPLAAAHVNQYTTSEGKSPWEVQENETNGLLATLPRNFTEAEVFRVLHFARKFELLAFNIGMTKMKKEATDYFNAEKKKLIRVIDELTKANEKLSEKLGSLIGEQEG